MNGEAVAVVTEKPKLSLAATLAAEYGMEATPFLAAVRQVVFPTQDRKGNAPTDSHVIAYLSVCQQYGLNPFIGHVWPFPQRDGGFKPVASVDGWIHIMNNNPNFDGCEYKEILDEKGNLIAGEMTIYRKDRKIPSIHREWLSEVQRDTEPWKMKHRMLENRVTCQAVRRAFGVGVPDQDDAERAEEINITSQSTVMERKTLDKTEVLKEKIKAKKETKEKAPEPEQAPAPPPEEPLPFDNDIPDLPPPPPAYDPESLLSELDRSKIISVLMGKKGDRQEVQKQFRAHIFSYGYTNTKEIKYKDFSDILAWSEALTI